MMINHRAESAIRAALTQYCRTFDEARFEEFAALFGRGRWFMVSDTGSRPVLDWINQHIWLYDGKPLTRHQVSGLEVSAGDDQDSAAFSCHIRIFQQLPGEDERLLARARFTGTFRRFADSWYWHEHVMAPEETGDLSTHIKGGTTTVTPKASHTGDLLSKATTTHPPSRLVHPAREALAAVPSQAPRPQDAA